jgi:hypothetical protein
MSNARPVETRTPFDRKETFLTIAHLEEMQDFLVDLQKRLALYCGTDSPAMIRAGAAADTIERLRRELS